MTGKTIIYEHRGFYGGEFTAEESGKFYFHYPQQSPVDTAPAATPLDAEWYGPYESRSFAAQGLGDLVYNDHPIPCVRVPFPIPCERRLRRLSSFQSSAAAAP
jgi:hypothetical protein